MQANFGLLSLCVFLFHCYEVQSIKCYTCVSHKSWDECNNNAHKMDCGDLANLGRNYSCVKQYEVYLHPNGSAKHDQETYKRDCGMKNHCEDLQEFCIQNKMACKSRCCKTDYCNSSSKNAPNFSPFLGILFFVFVMKCSQ